MEPYDYFIVTSLGIKLIITESEFFFYRSLIMLVNEGVISAATHATAEWTMMSRGYARIG